MELTDSKGNVIKPKDANDVIKSLDIQTAPEVKQDVKRIKASDRTRSHLNNDATKNRTFNNMTDLEKNAEKIYAAHNNKVQKELEEDVANGFDISSPESVIAFQINYTPIGNVVLVKEIHDEETTEKKIILPSGLDSKDKKYVVMVPGLLVSILKRGDVITLKPTPSGKLDAVDRKFNGVKFYELDYYAIAGVYQSESIMQDRVKAINENYKASQA